MFSLRFHPTLAQTARSDFADLGILNGAKWLVSARRSPSPDKTYSEIQFQEYAMSAILHEALGLNLRLAFVNGPASS